jgi:acetyl esterase
MPSELDASTFQRKLETLAEVLAQKLRREAPKYRTEQATNLRWFADQGYLVLSPDYELSTPQRSTWMTAGQDVACAFLWAQEHVADYGGDPSLLFGDGGSAGGQLVLSQTYAANSGNPLAVCDGKTAVSVKAVAADVPALDPLSFYNNPDPLLGSWSREMVAQYLGGPPDQYPNRVSYVSSKTYITRQAPPTIIFLRNDDHLVPIEGSLAFIDQNHRAGTNPRVVRLPLADHVSVFNFHSVADQAFLQLTYQFYCEHGGLCAAEK